MAKLGTITVPVFIRFAGIECQIGTVEFDLDAPVDGVSTGHARTEVNPESVRLARDVIEAAYRYATQDGT